MGRGRVAKMPHQRTAKQHVPVSAVPKEAPEEAPPTAQDYAAMVYERLKKIDAAIAEMKGNKGLIGPRAFQQRMTELNDYAIEASRHALLALLQIAVEGGR